jgi:LemA protein
MQMLLLGSLFVLLLISAGLIVMFFGIYNALIANRENVKKAWANIDVILKQRYDEIPQLVKICEQYVKYEKSQIDRIMNAREKMVSGPTIDSKADGFNEVTAGIRGLLAVGEAYPDLKANSNFLQIQTRLAALEESIADRREFYNDSVNVFNIRIQTIPDIFIARSLGYTPQSMFEIKAEEKVLPSLDINLST